MWLVLNMQFNHYTQQKQALKPFTFKGSKDYTFFVCYDSNFTYGFQFSIVWTGIILIALPV